MGLAFAPRPIRSSGPLHGRAAAVAVLVTAFILAALVKPWDRIPNVPPEPRPAPPPTASIRSPSPPERTTAPRLDASAVASLLDREHDGWGMQVVTLGAGGRLTSAWLSAVAPPAANWDGYGLPTWTVTPQSPAERVVALGITAPSAQVPLAMRMWWLGEDGSARLVPLRDAALEAAGNNLERAVAAWEAPLDRRLFLAPLDPALPGPGQGGSVDGIAVAPASVTPGDELGQARWTAGLYRIDLLVGAVARSMTFALASAWPTSVPERTPVDAGSSARDHVASVAAAADFDEPRLAWADGSADLQVADEAADADGGDATAVSFGLDPVVAWIERPDVAAIGVLLPRGTAAADLRIRRLSPRPWEVDVPGTADARGTRDDRLPGGPSAPPANLALHWTPTGLALAGGIYEIAVAWYTQFTAHTARWIVGLSGGTEVAASTDVWWQAASRAASAVGRWGIVAVGGPGVSAPALRAARVASVVPVDDPDATVDDGELEREGYRRSFALACNGPVLVDDEEFVLGVAAPPTEAPGRVTVERLSRVGAPRAVPVASAPSPFPGLVLIAPRDGGRWLPGVYRLSVETSGPRRSFDVAVGIAEPRSGVILPPCSSGRDT